MPREKIYTKLKAIKLTPSQALRWDPKGVKQFLDGMVDDNIFKNAFRELYQIFNEFSKNPTRESAVQLFTSANLNIIDKAKEMLD